jgi:hypothetical protein
LLASSHTDHDEKTAQQGARANDHGRHASCSEQHEPRRPRSWLILNVRQKKMIPLRIVPYSAQLGDRLFGGPPDLPVYRQEQCLSFFTLALNATTLLHVGLTGDFRIMLANVRKLTFSDGEVLSIHEIPHGTVFVDGASFHSTVSLERQSNVSSEDIEATGDIHKIGGESYYLQLHPTRDLEFIAQIAFPDHRDLLLSLDWPTGEYTFELFRDTARREYCAIWRMHA